MAEHTISGKAAAQALACLQASGAMSDDMKHMTSGGSKTDIVSLDGNGNLSVAQHFSNGTANRVSVTSEHVGSSHQTAAMACIEHSPKKGPAR